MVKPKCPVFNTHKSNATGIPLHASSADKDEHRLYLAITFHFDSIENSDF